MTNSLKQPPSLPKRPHYVGFGKVDKTSNRGVNPMPIPIYLKDSYFYLRDETRSNKEIIDHLKKENEYTQLTLSDLQSKREQVYQTLKSYIQETDETYPVPYPNTDYQYYTRTVEGDAYQIHCRRLKSQQEPEEILLNENELAKQYNFLDVYDDVTPSSDHTRVLYAIDTVGDEMYSIYLKNLQTQETKLLIQNIASGDLEWNKDGTGFYYISKDEAQRNHKVWKFSFDTHDSVCIYTEDDELFDVSLSKTNSGQFLLVGSTSSETSEYSFLDLSNNQAELTLFHKREYGVQYDDIEHHNNDFYFLTNKDDSKNFKLCKTSIVNTNSWKDVLEYNSIRKLDSLLCFHTALVLFGRQDGFTRVWIREFANGQMEQLKFNGEQAYTVEPSDNFIFDTTKMRFTYTDYTTPKILYDYDFASKQLQKLKQRPCPNYNPELYETTRIEIPSIYEDNVNIPMTLVYRKSDSILNKRRPIHLYGYGSYEISCDPEFTSTILPYLDHGITYAVAHVRGGGEMGRDWYESAKYLNKKRTFEDFVSCAQYLIQNGYTTTHQLTCEGRSAGGLLIGAVLNMRPDLFQAALMGVPFVDVMNTMSDASIPLTTGEWEEWGNPNEEKYFHYMLSYSPYENINFHDKFPNILVTAGLYDPRVAYWESAKYVAKVREYLGDKSEILLKMDLDSGHFSASDRYFYLKEKAFDIVYILNQLNVLKDASE